MSCGGKHDFCNDKLGGGTPADMAEVAAVAKTEEFAALDNAARGLSYSPVERRRAAGRLLRLHPDWANNRLAAALGINRITVESIRQEMEKKGDIAVLTALVGGRQDLSPRYRGGLAGNWRGQTLKRCQSFD